MAMQLGREDDREQPGRSCRQTLEQRVDIQMQRRVATTSQAEREQSSTTSQPTNIRATGPHKTVAKEDAHQRPGVALEARVVALAGEKASDLLRVGPIVNLGVCRQVERRPSALTMTACRRP
jgi:hypothetical protein